MFPEIDEPNNLMTSGELPPIPEATDSRDTPYSPDVAEGMSFEKADICALEAELLGAHHTTELCRLRVKSLMKELAETNKLCEKLADLPEYSSDDEELAATRGTHGPIIKKRPFE